MQTSTLNIFDTERSARALQDRMREHPFGDPFSGAAVGQYHKSKGIGMVLGVVASVVTMGAALPMLASATLATQIAGGAMMAGGVLSGVGAISGNKKLTKIGGVLSLAGGIGGAVSGLTGGLGMGSGSTSVQNMAGSMMESINSTGINVFNPETIASAKAAGASSGAGGGSAAESFPVKNPDVQEIQLAGKAGDGGVINTAGDAAAKKAAEEAAKKAAAEQGLLTKAMGAIENNPNTTKLLAETVKGFAAGADQPDQQANLDALTERYKADTSLLKTQNEVAQYKAANAQKQVAMISADAPDIDAQIQAAKAKGIPYAFIPAVGKDFAANQPKAWGAGTQSAATTNAQTPARQVNNTQGA